MTIEVEDFCDLYLYFPSSSSIFQSILSGVDSWLGDCWYCPQISETLSNVIVICNEDQELYRSEKNATFTWVFEVHTLVWVFYSSLYYGACICMQAFACMCLKVGEGGIFVHVLSAHPHIYMHRVWLWLCGKIITSFWGQRFQGVTFFFDGIHAYLRSYK